LQKKINSPSALITRPVKADHPFNWKEFGDWYSDLFEQKTLPDYNLRETARTITAELKTDLEKLEAILSYCRQHIRYEQVYLEFGEIIPNDCRTVLVRGYGDCKDYSVLIHSMAESIGIKTFPALCFRGRGERDIEDIAVNQFNHMLLYYRDNGKDFWIDGTNRSGKPGVTTSDLINQTALVIDKGNSLLRKIENSEDNMLAISGSLRNVGTDLSGGLTFDLSGQYAADFFHYDYVSSDKIFNDLIYSWVKEFVSSKVIIKNIRTGGSKGIYSIIADCTFPNAVVKIDSCYYCNGLQIFSSIIPQLPLNIKEEDIYYYPKLCKVEINVLLPGLSEKESSFRFDNRWSLDPGPFTKEGRKIFLFDLKALQELMSKNYKLIKRDVL